MALRELLLTCEHGGNRIPPRYTSLFQDARGALDSHEGFDPGALRLARQLARDLGAPLFSASISRLLIDLNRSPDHRRLFSRYVAQLGSEEKRKILEGYYVPHRTRVEEWVRARVVAGIPVLHVAVHTFTPRRDGKTRRADVALLYDPSRRGERNFCRHWTTLIRQRARGLRTRRNYPYRGTADGLTTSLRRRFGSKWYWGVELEVNQKHLLPAAPNRKTAGDMIGACLSDTLHRQLRRGVCR